MEYIQDTSWKKVSEAYEADHGSRADAPWERMILSRANKFFGQWTMVRFDPAELGELVLCEHEHGVRSKRQGEVVLGTPNMSIAEALGTYGANLNMLNAVNSHCYSAVLIQRELIRSRGMRALFLATRTFTLVNSDQGGTYRSRPAVLDGFHRLLAAASMPDKPKSIEAYIACSARYPVIRKAVPEDIATV